MFTYRTTREWTDWTQIREQSENYYISRGTPCRVSTEDLESWKEVRLRNDKQFPKSQEIEAPPGFRRFLISGHVMEFADKHVLMKNIWDLL